MDVLRSPEASSRESAPAQAETSIESQQELIRRLKPAVLAILRDHLRELERRGLL